jgi:hypothetical protein
VVESAHGIGTWGPVSGSREGHSHLSLHGTFDAFSKCELVVSEVESNFCFSMLQPPPLIAVGELAQPRMWADQLDLAAKSKFREQIRRRQAQKDELKWMHAPKVK